MSLIVQKFGGSSVRDAQRIRNVAGIIAETYLEGNDVLVVLSAQGDTTDDLIAKAEEINSHPSKREMDMLLSTGEQISVALCAMALESMGLPCVSLTAWQVGIQTTAVHGDARIKRIDSERVQAELDQHRIVLITGFQGMDRAGDVTTLGRGGSDTSAVALAAAFRAKLCQIYTDVDGVYTADPRIVPNARHLDEITYDEMLELASQGAGVLHNRSVELAKKFRVDLEVLSSLERKPGTKVKEVTKVEKTTIAGVAKDTSIARIALIGLRHNPGVAFQVFDLLSKHNIILPCSLFHQISFKLQSSLIGLHIFKNIIYLFINSFYINRRMSYISCLNHIKLFNVIFNFRVINNTKHWYIFDSSKNQSMKSHTKHNIKTTYYPQNL